MAVDAFLIIVALVIAVVLVGAIGMTIIYFQHPDDKNVALVPKAVTLWSLWLSCGNVLILPFDVTNTQTGSDLDMNVMWSISIYATAVTLVLILPFAYFYYENDNDPSESTRGCCGLIPGWNSQFCEGLKWSLSFLVCFTLVLVIMFLVLNEAEIPVTYRSYNFNNYVQRVEIGSDIPSLISCSRSNRDNCESEELTITLSVTFEVYTLALLAFLGWFLFVLFAGTGLPALPWDLFNDWYYRPKPISLKVYADEKKKDE